MDKNSNCKRIHFANTFSSNRYIFLEIDENIAQDLLIHNKGLSIRGRKTDEIVICSQTHTYKCTKVEISNSLVLLNDLPICGPKQFDEQSVPHQIISISNVYFEVILTNPNVVFRINELLAAHKVNLFRDTENIFESVNGFTWNKLISEVQISEDELKQELLPHPIIFYHGRIFLMDQESVYELLDQIIELTTRDMLTTNKLNLQLLQGTLSKHIPIDAIDWFLRKFCTRNEDDGNYAMNEAIVSHARAEQLLRNMKLKPEQQLNLDDFENMVNNLLPSDFRFREEHVFGLALINNNTTFHGRKTLRKLLPCELPIDLNERLSMLFSLKTAWKREEIQPYISEYCHNTAKIDEFLLNFCRITGNGLNRRFVYKQIF